ncbi:protein translocase subunit SecF [Acidocella sp.]|uniref:protein translocase subunit SecF n=1 Tax=Acidocella sp. TaxID=50710 RepID=UPI002635574F|nr:protein translocase subunit SecF [Acidocella sp.]
MFYKPAFRFVPDGTKIRFMNGRFAGLITSAVLSLASVILFFHPGLNMGLDFKGGVVLQVQTQQKANFPALRSALAAAGLGDAALQAVGSHGNQVLISLESRNSAAATETAIGEVQTALKKAAPGATIQSTQAVGASVSSQLFAQGLEALGLSFVMILIYIWFRFEWQFAIGAVVTLLLDTTKTIGFMVVTRIPFDLVTIAAILTIIGYSTNDKVVVYDRMRENLRKYKTMNLRELIDLSINETLNRTLGTSGTVFLAALPLALFGGSALSGFAWIMLFGIVIGTSSSIFIAAPILLFLGEHRLRRSATAPKKT